ncbi:DUF1343 domain-containing protein [Vagococcus sp. PNs007]|uniref:DUF1343 domain-containing protein n=1 Tax=Vagococcus proximus TaxID=2991417 RepID=A0ABT5WYV8_9ENTE|nr:DUF1343 domain-containing protein [Vagococcus proximus]MDF0478937.1 DUF1343 domain-containing protein [Vagococcus proximus]
MLVNVKNGVDRLNEFEEIFRNKKIGLITNITGMTKSFISTVDALDDYGDVKVLFAPEHGVRGDKQAGEVLGSYYDSFYKKDVISLYGDKKAPSIEEIKNLDLLVYDIQDIGTRYYTFIYTMYLSMKACENAGIKFIILDRPDIFGGEQVSGNMINPQLFSFVGDLPLPNQYGMTVGELALFTRKELNITVDLQVIKMVGWYRGLAFSETDLPWIAPSPNIPTVETAKYYVGTCLFEGTNLSEGRGTTLPFEQVGAPWLDNDGLCKELNTIFKNECIHFQPVFFTPTFSKYKNQLCAGIKLYVEDFFQVDIIEIVIEVIKLISLKHDEFKINIPFENSKHLFYEHLSGYFLDEIPKKNLSEFNKKREHILLYK